MVDVMSIEFKEPSDVLITDPSYLDGNVYAVISEEFARGLPYKYREVPTGGALYEPVFWAPMNDGLKLMGLSPSLVGNTVFGEWRCGVWHGRERIGGFSSKSGRYAVLKVDDAFRALCPGFGDWLARFPDDAFVARGFSGKVTVNAVRRLYAVKSDGRTEYKEDLDISIEGIGTDPSMDFRTKRENMDI